MKQKRESLAERLRSHMDDMEQLYLEAKLDDNVPRMESLAKSIAAYAKQIKDQETYERLTVGVDEMQRLAAAAGTLLGKVVRKHATDETGVAILEEFHADVAKLIELEETE